MEPRLHDSSYLIYLVHCCIPMPATVLAYSRCLINNCGKNKKSSLVHNMHVAFGKPSLLPPIMSLNFFNHKMKRLGLIFFQLLPPHPQLWYSRSLWSWQISEWCGSGLNTDRALTYFLIWRKAWILNTALGFTLKNLDSRTQICFLQAGSWVSHFTLSFLIWKMRL